MARLEDIPEPTRTAAESLACPAFDTTPFVSGPALAKRRVALVSSAALIRRGDTPFAVGTSEFRELSADWSAADILISHVSINFDRAGFQRDLNVVYPLERLHELAREGVIASVAETHYTVMGSTDPATMVDTSQRMAAAMHADRVTAVVLAPV